MTKSKWTVMIYMAGDNSLYDAAKRDLAEMRAVGSSDDVNFVVLHDNKADVSAKRMRVLKDGKDEQIETLSAIDTGSPEQLVDFVDWAASMYPAERYALILWSHGDGWQQSELAVIAEKVLAENYNASERSVVNLPRVLFRSTWEKMLAKSTPTTRAICYDDNSGHSLDAVELGKALGEIKDKLGQKLDVLGMDACLMSSLEVGVEVQPFVKCWVAAEEVTPDVGWAYDVVLTKLKADPDMTARVVATMLVKEYVASVRATGFKGNVTLTAYDLDKLDELTAGVNALATRLTALMTTNESDIRVALQKTAGFCNNTLWDLGMFCHALMAAINDATLHEAAQQVLDALKPSEAGPLIAHAAKGKKVGACGGVSIYLPALRNTTLSEFYAKIRFAQNSQWLTFLQHFKDL